MNLHVTTKRQLNAMKQAPYITSDLSPVFGPNFNLHIQAETVRKLAEVYKQFGRNKSFSKLRSHRLFVIDDTNIDFYKVFFDEVMKTFDTPIIPVRDLTKLYSVTDPVMISNEHAKRARNAFSSGVGMKESKLVILDNKILKILHYVGNPFDGFAIEFESESLIEKIQSPNTINKNAYYFAPSKFSAYFYKGNDSFEMSVVTDASNQYLLVTKLPLLATELHIVEPLR